MDLGLTDRVALVAGASKGIGRGIAEVLLEEGARVLLTGRGEADLAATHRELSAQHGERVVAFRGDMTATADVRAALARAAEALGPVDVLVANVGGGFLKPGWDVGDDDLDAALTHNLTGTLRLVREGIRVMEGRAGGSIVIISSIAGVDALGAPFAYGVAKAGLNHFATNTARLIGPDLRINVVAPGNILFEGGSWERNVRDRPEAWERWIRREVSLRRFGTPREIADVVAFLASERAAFVTGATWIADGGQVRTTA
jgi:3-oxoacyl-[acyl-carrier protein] reductase